jgi:hypothetical protein
MGGVEEPVAPAEQEPIDSLDERGRDRGKRQQEHEEDDRDPHEAGERLLECRGREQ